MCARARASHSHTPPPFQIEAASALEAVRSAKDVISDGMSIGSPKTTSSDEAAKTKKKKSKKRKTLRKKKESTTLKFNPNEKEPEYNWVQELRGESKTVRCVSLMILACSCAVTSRSFHAPHPTELYVYTQSPYMRAPAPQTAGKNNKAQREVNKNTYSP